MFVYVKDRKIIFKSEEKRSIPWASVIETKYKLEDDLILEDGTIKLYKKSERYKKDHHLETLKEKAERLERENTEMKTTIDKRIQEDREVNPTEYHRLIYKEQLRTLRKKRIKHMLAFLEKANADWKEKYKK